MANLLSTVSSTTLSLVGYGIFLWGGVRLVQRKGLPKPPASSLGIGVAFLSLGMARLILNADANAPLILGVIFCIMSLIALYWEKSGAEWAEN